MDHEKYPLLEAIDRAMTRQEELQPLVDKATTELNLDIALCAELALSGALHTLEGQPDEAEAALKELTDIKMALHSKITTLIELKATQRYQELQEATSRDRLFD